MPAKNTQPNILFIFTDQQRADTIAALGNPIIKTPAMDRLVREGTSFTRAYTPSPVCVPARCSLHYGLYPQNSRCAENGQPFPVHRVSYAQALTDAGYRTHAIGKCHFMPDMHALLGFESRQVQEEIVTDPTRDDYLRHLKNSGYGHITDPHGVRGEMYYIPQPAQMPQALHPTQWVGDQSVDFIRRQSADRPWMLYAGIIHPHPPMCPPAPWHKLYRTKDMPLPFLPPGYQSLYAYINKNQNRYKYRDRGMDMQLLRTLKAYYYGCISFIDFQVGRMIQSLEETGQLDNTLIVLSSDHGELLGDYNCFGKRSMHDAAARVPLVARLPGRFAADSKCGAPASLVDVMPTFLAAAHADAPADLDGVDLAALAKNPSLRDKVFIQYDRAGKGLYSVVTEHEKFTWSAADQKPFYFNRLADPQESKNLVDDPAHAVSVRQLSAALHGQLSRSDFPEATDGAGWKAWPVLDVPQDPDKGLLIQDHPWADQFIPGYSSR